VSAPASAFAERQETVAALVEVYAYLRAIGRARLQPVDVADGPSRPAPAKPDDSLTEIRRCHRPLGAGARPMQHESGACPGQETGAAFEEDGRHEPTDV
jgi:hypothetical protein